MRTISESVADVTGVKPWDYKGLGTVDKIFKHDLLRIGEQKAKIMSIVNRPVNKWSFALQLMNRNGKKPVCKSIDEAVTCLDELIREDYLVCKKPIRQARSGEGETISLTKRGRYLHDYLVRRTGSPIIMANDGQAKSTG